MWRCTISFPLAQCVGLLPAPRWALEDCSTPSRLTHHGPALNPTQWEAPSGQGLPLRRGHTHLILPSILSYPPAHSWWPLSPMVASSAIRVWSFILVVPELGQRRKTLFIRTL